MITCQLIFLYATLERQKWDIAIRDTYLVRPAAHVVISVFVARDGGGGASVAHVTPITAHS